MQWSHPSRVFHCRAAAATAAAAFHFSKSRYGRGLAGLTRYGAAGLAAWLTDPTALFWYSIYCFNQIISWKLVGTRTIQRSVVCVTMTAKPLHSSKIYTTVISVSIKTFVNFAKVGFTIFSSNQFSIATNGSMPKLP